MFLNYQSETSLQIMQYLLRGKRLLHTKEMLKRDKRSRMAVMLTPSMVHYFGKNNSNNNDNASNNNNNNKTIIIIQ